MQRHTITLEHPTDWQGFRTAARALVQANVPPPVSYTHLTLPTTPYV